MLDLRERERERESRTVYYVSGGGTALADACAKAKANDIIYVEPGKYYGKRINVNQNNVKIIGLGNVSQNIIDATGILSTSVLYGRGASSTQFRNFLISGFICTENTPRYDCVARGVSLYYCEITKCSSLWPFEISGNTFNNTDKSLIGHGSNFFRCNIHDNCCDTYDSYGCAMYYCNIHDNVFRRPFAGDKQCLGASYNKCLIHDNDFKGNVFNGNRVYCSLVYDNYCSSLSGDSWFYERPTSCINSVFKNNIGWNRFVYNWGGRNYICNSAFIGNFKHNLSTYSTFGLNSTIGNSWVYNNYFDNTPFKETGCLSGNTFNCQNFGFESLESNNFRILDNSPLISGGWDYFLSQSKLYMTDIEGKYWKEGNQLRSIGAYQYIEKLSTAIPIKEIPIKEIPMG